MANEIKADDIFDSKGFDDIASNFDKVIGRLEKFISEIKNAGDAINKNLTGRMAELAKLDFSNAKDIAKFSSLEQAINKERQRSIALETQLLKLKKELNNAETNKKKVIDIAEKTRKAAAIAQERDLKKLQKETEKQIAKEKKTEAQRRKLNSEYTKTQIQLSRLNKVLKDLQTKQAKGIELTQKEIAFLTKYTKVQKDLDGTLKKVDASLGMHQRNVGNYTESIKDAINETGYFNGALNKLSGIYNIVSKAQENATTKTQKFGLVLKGAGILGIITVLKGLSDTFTKTAEGADKLELATARASTAFDVIARSASNYVLSSIDVIIAQSKIAFGIGNQTEAMKDLLKAQSEQLLSTVSVTEKLRLADEAQIELTKATQAYRIELRKLNLAQQAFALDEEDAIEISNDATRSLKQRNEALEQSFVLQRKRLGVEATIANKSLEFTNKQIAIELKKAGITQELSQAELTNINQNAELRGKLSNEILDEQNKNVLEQRRLADAIDDLGRQQNQRRRQRLEEELSIDIALLRSKKNSTKLLSDELQKQIDDEALQLDLREKLANDQLKLEREVTDAIIKRIKEVAKAEAKSTGVAIPLIDKENLLLEGNAILLEEKIKKLGLSEGLTMQLADAIKKAQEAETKGLENLNKLAVDKIKLEQRLQEILLENKKTQAENIANEAQQERDRLVELQSKTQETILEDENAFNQLTISQRETLGEETKKLIDIETKQRKEALAIQSKLEIDAIENSNKQFEEKEALKQQIAKKSADDIAKIEKDASDKKNAQDIKDLAFFKETREKQIQIIANDVNKLLDSATEAQSKKFDQINSNIEKEIERNNTALDAQRQRAEQGLSNELAFRQAQSDKLALVQEREKKRQEKSQELLAYLKLFTGYAEQNPEKALQFTLRDMALMTAGKMLYANEGNEFVSADGKTKSIFKQFAKGADVVPAMLAEGERVVTKDKNIKYNEALHAIHNDKFNEMYLPKSVLENGKKSTGFAESALNSMLLNGLINVNSETNNRIANLEKAILSKEHTNFSWNEIYGGIQKEVEKAGKKTTTIYKVSKPRIN